LVTGKTRNGHNSELIYKLAGKILSGLSVPNEMGASGLNCFNYQGLRHNNTSGKVFAWQLDEAFPAWTPWQIISWGQLNSVHLIFFYFYSRFPCLIEFVFLSRERVSNITIKTLVMNKKKRDE
jgi:hypothetical protein